MSYNDRVILVREVSKKGFLGDEIEKVKSDPIPCERNSLKVNESMALFGRWDPTGFKLHLQGHHDEFQEVIYQGKTMKTKGKAIHRHSTVIYL